MTDNYIN